MLREGFQQFSTQDGFRPRGKEPGRLENFSDAVFALAITLLLISTTPPANFEQIRRFSFEIIPFVMCISLIILIWHEHFVFFCRYGLRDAKVIALNTLFLAIVLFYVYPLKFVTRLILYPIAALIGKHDLVSDIASMISASDMGDLMIIYGLGAFSVFAVLSLMYRYALRQADALQLTELERFDTKVSINSNRLMCLVPLLSVALAILFRGSWVAGPVAGCTYLLYTPIMTMHGRRVHKNRASLIASAQNPNPTPVDTTPE
ncbi:MAG: TMEM175 family protein [Flammeovirgaceae bacterium]